MVVVDSKTKRLKALHAKMEGEGFFSDMVAKVKQYLNPKLTSQGIYSTDVGIDRKSSVRQPIQAQQTPQQMPQQPEKQGYFSTLMYGRNDFPPAARAILKAHGEKRITKAVVIRQPVMSFNTKLLNFISFGAFQESLDKQPYDTLFHLRSVFTLEDGTKVQVEKSEVIHIDTKITVVKGQQEQEVDLPQEPLTINKMLEGAKGILKGNMYSYDGFKNNCQDFQLALYRGSDLLDPQLEAFIKQDVSEIAESSPIISKAANLVTGLGGKFNELIHGAGIHKKFNKTHLVQSVVFDKKKWKLNDAIKWLDENNYHSPKVDTTTKTMRFRQIDPSPYKSPDWKYTTHRLGNGIDLIILYRMTGNEHPIETPIGLSKGQIHHLIVGHGDLIHIDLGSHNAKGKAKMTMGGGALGHTGTEDNAQYNPMTGMMDYTGHSGNPMKSYSPLDMKITTQNKMLNNLKKSDLQDLDRLKTEVKRSNYDREAIIQKIKGITKSRVKKEVKAVKTAKPRNLKTRGSLESKKALLEKRVKRKYVKKVKTL